MSQRRLEVRHDRQELVTLEEALVGMLEGEERDVRHPAQLPRFQHSRSAVRNYRQRH
jgi:hypothetical protein